MTTFRSNSSLLLLNKTVLLLYRILIIQLPRVGNFGGKPMLEAAWSQVGLGSRDVIDIVPDSENNVFKEIIHLITYSVCFFLTTFKSSLGKGNNYPNN